MLATLLGLFQLIWLFGRGHRAVVLENLALRQQLAIYKRKKKRPRLVGRDRWFWIVLSAGTRPVFNTIADLSVNVAVLVTQLWLRWPQPATFGR